VSGLPPGGDFLLRRRLTRGACKRPAGSPTYETLGYDGSQFRTFAYYFHAIDQAVMNQAVADMQWFYAAYGTHF
jgi:hypothetical protein